MNQELSFDKVFEFAIQCWPEEIIFGNLSYYETPDGNTGYTIDGLPEFPDSIEKQYSGSPIRIIAEKLHRNIYSFLGYAARDLTKIRMKDLRVETLKKDLEADLNKCLLKPESITQDDIDIIQRYLSINGSLKNT